MYTRSNREHLSIFSAQVLHKIIMTLNALNTRGLNDRATCNYIFYVSG